MNQIVDDGFIAAGIKRQDLDRLFHQLAAAKVAAIYCTGTEDQKGIAVMPWIVTSVKLTSGRDPASGETLSREQLDQEVVSEANIILERFLWFAERNKNDPNAIIRWIASANKARRMYVKTLQEALDDVVRINAEAARKLTWGLAAACIAQCAAELALIGVGVFPVQMIGCRVAATAPTLATAIGKVVFSVGATTVISTLDNWGNPRIHMLVFVDDAKAFFQSLPGYAADHLDIFFASMTRNFFKKARGAPRAFESVRKARDAIGLANRTAAGQMMLRTKAATFTGYICAVWSAYDSLSKMAQRLTDDATCLSRPDPAPITPR